MNLGFSQIVLLGITAIVIIGGISGYVYIFYQEKENTLVNTDTSTSPEITTNPTEQTSKQTIRQTITPKPEQTKLVTTATPIKTATPIPQNYTPSNNNSGTKIYWRLGINGWEPVGSVPQCPNPYHIIPPVDISLATSVLYPGQIRSGNNYEPGGGFRFDKSPNNVITVKVPADAQVVGGARFLVQGQLQYYFDLTVPCGIMFRYDHLLTLSPEFQKISERFTPPKENDTRTTFLDTPISVSANDTIATAVGLNNNTFVSWTVFDHRQKNEVSRTNLSWAAEHSWLEHYAVCPYDFLSPDLQKTVYSLPASDIIAGNKSDFCK